MLGLGRRIVQHIHLPASPSEGLYPSYKTAAAVQELLRRRLLKGKDDQARRVRPPQTVISFTPAPTYTLGRRQLSASSLSPAEIARLKAPLRIEGIGSDEKEHVFHPAVMNSPRGGLATYHGPGQVVLWPVMMIRGPPHLVLKQFTVRCYSRLLEDTTIAVLQRLFGLAGFTTDDPGVWVSSGLGTQLHQLRKISAMGIHLRRHVSSLGVAINLDMPTTSAVAMPGADDTDAGSKAEEYNPWARFVACGLEGKGVTCVQEELLAADGAGIPGLDAEVVAKVWVEELAGRIGHASADEAVHTVPRDKVEELVAEAESRGFLDAVAKNEI
ncbi:hypothetical protein M406DRAFT_249912 [Cryphonectria parasitica EP155]|uniref:BPL/LPL catalytic domain-containing protein n=1 Tax=Cryphonectria parasitica (strain ATCC 38755 / EP155) TaxID=660469 RepID=A0A9P5CSW7_CRYP1|nr:uncharacterized protein M406DRAFT_249912 [Cryphonectria parasitica EP155]KAF3768545.1 hypothetical protein M406DRAFT_249912 [Cryphonectria parasitica EP155]